MRGRADGTHRVDYLRRGDLADHGHQVDQGHPLAPQGGRQHLVRLARKEELRHLHGELEAGVHGVGGKEPSHHGQHCLGHGEVLGGGVGGEQEDQVVEELRKCMGGRRVMVGGDVDHEPGAGEDGEAHTQHGEGRGPPGVVGDEKHTKGFEGICLEISHQVLSQLCFKTKEADLLPSTSRPTMESMSAGNSRAAEMQKET